MSDLINRQAAIDATWKEPTYTDPLNVLTEVRDRIKALPSAQPEPCEDAVSRADVVDMLEMFPFAEYSEYETAREVVKRLPSVTLPSTQPERKTGKWKVTYLDHKAIGERQRILYCSECNQCIAYPVNFCPNCGAKMEG